MRNNGGLFSTAMFFVFLPGSMFLSRVATSDDDGGSLRGMALFFLPSSSSPISLFSFLLGDRW